MAYDVYINMLYGWVFFYSNKMETAEALPDVLMAAKNEGRLVCGVYESGQLLEE